MLRRPPTSIELKLDDMHEYEQMRQQQSKEKSNNKFFDLPAWQGPKTKQEVYNRVGYIPERNAQNRNNFL